MSKIEKPKYFMKNTEFVTILKNYRVTTKKIIFNLLRYFFRNKIDNFYIWKYYGNKWK